jgi:hypothetical protein
MITADKIQAIRQAYTADAPDGLDRLLLLRQRKILLAALESCEEQMQPTHETVNVATTDVATLAKIVGRGVFAAAFPLFLFSIIGGVSAALAVASFRWTLSLFF